jgi:NADP-dependent 3-hydroxy acid dehydrogenase YdfG
MAGLKDKVAIITGAAGGMGAAERVRRKCCVSESIPVRK